MKAITIKEPFASLIANGIKEYEFRTWKTKYRGDILIHAGKGVNKKALERFKHYGIECQNGCLIAVATLTDCVEINEDVREILKNKNSEIYNSVIKDTDWKGYGFKLENIKKIKPIEINGKLSFWDYEGEIEWLD